MTALDTGPTRRLPGVVNVVRDGDFLGVIAEREEVALTRGGAVAGGRRVGQHPSLPDEDDLPAFLTAAPANTTESRRRGRPATAAPHGSSVGDVPPAVHRARFDRPVMRHRDGDWGDRLQIWSHSQSVYSLRREISRGN